MKFAVFSLFLSSVGAAAGGKSAVKLDRLDGDLGHLLVAKFRSWTELYGKEYEGIEEAKQRFEIWVENHAKIEKHNNQVPAPSVTLGHNSFSDMTEDEFRAFFHLGKFRQIADENVIKPTVRDPELAEEVSRSLLELTLPDYVNWVEIGAVTPVKNQGACGACWAFSTTGALEGAKFIRSGDLTSLSEQNLLDCDHEDLGCSGGLMDDAFKFDEKSGGLCSEADYPYEAIQHSECRTDCEDVPGSIVQTFVDVPPGNERALLGAVAMQPISVAIQADQFVFQFYSSGVINDDTCGERGDIDHGVLAVGYGHDVDLNLDYFLVKNSWGDDWGDEGYVKIGRNSKNEFGMCSILKLASFPIVE